MKRLVPIVLSLAAASLALAACGGQSPAAPAAGSPASPPISTTPPPIAGAPSLPAAPQQPPPAAPPAPVPPQYQDVYGTLQSQVQSFASLAGSARPGGGTVVSAELPSADGNAVNPNVLQSGALAKSTQLIGTLQGMGIRGVTIQVGFPLLVGSFPDAATYTSFYAQVAAAVHAAGMVLTVELNPLFPAFSQLPVSSFYRGLTLPSYIADTHQEAQTIVDVMRPAYLSILNEPDTYTGNIHNPAIDLKDPSVGVAFVSGVLAGLRRGGTAVGAGTGTWTDPSYDGALLAGTSIDFVDLHMYPVAADDVANLQAQTREATAAHKQVVMSECWLYKESTDGQPIETNRQGAVDEQKVRTFSFWEPLDAQFLTAMIDYAAGHGFAVVSPFSTLNDFTYLTWTPQLDSESSQEVSAAFYRQASAAMAAGELSEVGSVVRSLAGA